MHIDLNTWNQAANTVEPEANVAYRACYTTRAPRVLRALQAWAEKEAAFDRARQQLGAAFGAAASSFTWLQAQFIGGVNVMGGVELDRHWRRPDRWGYRTLRLRARIPRDMQLIPPAVIHAEHERLLALWTQHCPARIDASEVWAALGVHLGSVSLWGGAFFIRDGIAYLGLGFELERGQPGTDWFDQATLIGPEAFNTARAQRPGAAA